MARPHPSKVNKQLIQDALSFSKVDSKAVYAVYPTRRWINELFREYGF